MTLLGLLSDSHDHAALVAVVASFFRERRVDLVFHLGDVMDPATLAPLEGLPLVVVRGNNDDEPSWPWTWTQEFSDVRVGATHGHHRGALARLVADCDVVLHGHTHRRRADVEDGTLVVNPGALYRTSMRTCALLELPSRRLVFYEVDEKGVRRL